MTTISAVNGEASLPEESKMKASSTTVVDPGNVTASCVTAAAAAPAAPAVPPKKRKPVSSVGRSVVDYVSEQELLQALQTVTPQGKAANDWILPIRDDEAEEQSIEKEMARLMNLQSYMMLDCQNERAFDRLTEEACDVFGVPTSLISLIDLGRQFLFSNTGAGGVRETTREVAFCSHTILNRNNFLVVNDTMEDDRFKDSPLVRDAPHLRFYAAAPLLSPEGHKLGTFCIEGPEPRPEGLTDAERAKLQQYAEKAMELMVERRKALRDRLSADAVCDEHRRHAAAATNLADALFHQGHEEEAMRLYQEAVQTLTQSWPDDGGHQQSGPSKERQDTILHLMHQMSPLPVSTVPEATLQEVLAGVRALFPEEGSAGKAVPQPKKWTMSEGIPGLFTDLTSKLQGMASAPRPIPGLVFAETFQIDLTATKGGRGFPLDDRPFTVTLAECSKATLFNMGLIYYHWGSPNMALQFFHLAASVSHKMSPLRFDPVDLACVNNMAQIHLLYRRPDEAVRLLEKALQRGNETLQKMYEESHVDDDDVDEASEGASVAEEADRATETLQSSTAQSTSSPSSESAAMRRTRRLRRKLARTILNMGHVAFFNADYGTAMQSCRDAAALLDEGMTGRTAAAVLYDMALVLYHQGQKEQALEYVDRYLTALDQNRLLSTEHIQTADALYHKAKILSELGRWDDCMEALSESLRIQRLLLCPDGGDGENGAGSQVGGGVGMLAETLCFAGKVHLARNDHERALPLLEEGLNMQRGLLSSKTQPTTGEEEKEESSKQQAPPLTFEVAQTLLDVGRAYHAAKNVPEALAAYREVLAWAGTFFGEDHPFVARIAGIVDNVQAEEGG